MPDRDAAQTSPAQTGAVPRDYATEISSLVESVQRDPEDAEGLERLARTAEDWVVAEGLGRPEPAEAERVALARWLAHLVPGGRIVHFGWRVGEVASALSAQGAAVTSFLDHTGRSMAAAVRHGSERVSFSVWSEVATADAMSCEMVVVETAGIHPVVPIDRARRLLRPDGWLAVLGLPTVADSAQWLDAGCFRPAPEGLVPCAPGSADLMISLFRRQSARANGLAARMLGVPVVRRPERNDGREDPVERFKRGVARALAGLR